MSFAELLHRLNSIPALSPTYMPFMAQNLILQALQRHLERHAYNLIQKWLPQECLVVGWTCPESLELHKLFPFFERYKNRLRPRQFHIIRTAKKWKREVIRIRHDAVHRHVLDRDSVRRKLRAAVGFAHSIGGYRCAQMFDRLHNALNDFLGTLDGRVVKFRATLVLQISHCQSYPLHRSRRLSLFPEAARRVLD